MDGLTQRDALFGRLYEIARDDSDVVIVAADMSAPALDRFRVEMPQQFVNVGIAEQNAILVGSGLALEGKKVFTYAISPFITLRCIEIIRVSCLIQDAPITVVGMSTGLGYSTDGPTHHLLEDIAVMRAFPGIRTISLTDSAMAGAYADISVRNTSGVLYLRVDKDIYPDVYSPASDFSRGLSRLREGSMGTIVATGPMVHQALEVADNLREEGIDVGVVDLFEIPIHTSEFLDAVAGTPAIVTVEEHFLPGGLGSAVVETLSDADMKMPVRRVGLSMANGYEPSYQYGGREITRAHYGLDAACIASAVKETVGRPVAMA